jgi:purine-cytosine permease-like protein
MTLDIAWFVLAALVGWLGIAVWLSARGGFRWRPDLLAWVCVIGLPLFVVYFGARNDLTVAGCVLAVAVWFACAALLRLLTRRRARRGGAGGGTQTPS